MSMYRQLWLAIITSMLLALAGSMVASMLSARSYLESQLSVKNTDNAAALALLLSQGNPDPVTTELVVASLFDRGHYELIRVSDPMGRTMVERVSDDTELGAPAWFAHALPIKATPGEAQISSGWKQFGTVTLISHSRYAYGALWESAYKMVLALTLAGLVGGYLGSLVLRRLKRPLDAVIDQAKAISLRRFVTIAEPRVPELRQLAVAMNATVGRLKAMFDEEAERLEAVRRQANCDALTGLANRSYFMAQLRETTAADDSTGGTIFIARLANLASVNQRLGRDATDEFLRAYGQVLTESASRYPDALAARLNGADFALLVPDLAEPQVAAEALLGALTQVASRFLPDQSSTWLGCGHFPRGIETGTILAQVDSALAAVQAEGHDGLRVINMRQDDDSPKSAQEWSSLIQRALDQRWVRLVSFPVSTLGGSLIHRECPLRLMFDPAGEWQPAGRFLPAAERLRLTPQLDLAAVALGLEQLETQAALPGLAINLSASSLELPEFRTQLAQLLRHRPEARRLWLEVAESGVQSHFAAFRALCLELHDVGCKLGVEHFGRQFSEIGRFHDLGLDYLKVDASFIRGLDSNPGNQAFLKGLASIARGIGLQVIAEGVTSQAELQTLGALGFDGATGPAIQEPV